MEKDIKTLQEENDKYTKVLKEIDRLVNADHVASIEARLIIKDLLKDLNLEKN